MSADVDDESILRGLGAGQEDRPSLPQDPMDICLLPRKTSFGEVQGRPEIPGLDVPMFDVGAERSDPRHGREEKAYVVAGQTDGHAHRAERSDGGDAVAERSVQPPSIVRLGPS